MLLLGISTISTGPFSIVMLVYQRVYHMAPTELLNSSASQPPYEIPSRLTNADIYPVGPFRHSLGFSNRCPAVHG